MPTCGGLRARGPRRRLLVSRLPNRATPRGVGFLRAAQALRAARAGRPMSAVVKPGVGAAVPRRGFDAEDSARCSRALASAASAAAPMPQRNPPARRRAALDRRLAPPADLDAPRDRSRQPPRALAHHPAAQRARLRRLPTALRSARREAGVPLYDERALGDWAPAPSCVTRQRPPGAGIVRSTARPGPRADRARRQGICFDTGGINLKRTRGCT
jgi:hypothetical protein